MFWIVEGKADSELTDPIVIAKDDAAHAWVRQANNHPDVPDTWGYLVASESMIAAANWATLKSSGPAYS